MALAKVGNGMLTLTGNNTYSGGTVVSGGTLQLGDGVSTNGSVAGNVNINNHATVVFANPAAQVYNGVVSGTGSVTKTGAGLLTLTSPQTYTGPTMVANGTLRLGAPVQSPITNFAAFGTSVNGYQDFFNSASLNPAWVSNVAGVFSLVTSGGLTPASGYLSVNGSGSDPDHLIYAPAGLAPSGNMEILALVQLNSISSGQDLSRAGVAVAVNTANYQGVNELFHGTDPTNIDTLNDDSAWENTLSYAYSTGTTYWMDLTIANSTNYTAAFWPADGTTPESSAVTTSGVLTGGVTSRTGFAGITGPSGQATSMNVYYALIENSQLPTITAGQVPAGSLPSGTALSLAASATIDLYGNNQTVGSLNGAGVVTNSNTGTLSILTAGGDGTSQTFSGTLQDGAGLFGLTMAGPGSLTLIGTNAYSGPTRISGGVLQAIDGVGLPTTSNLVFSGSMAQSGYGAVFQSNGTFIRAWARIPAKCSGRATAALQPAAAA